MFKYAYIREIDTLCEIVSHYLDGKTNQLTLTEKDCILIQYTYALYKDLTKHYYTSFKFMSNSNREDKKYLKYVLNTFKKYYELRLSMLYK